MAETLDYWREYYQKNPEAFSRALPIVGKAITEGWIRPNSKGVDLAAGTGGNSIPILEAIPGTEIQAVEFTPEGIDRISAQAEILRLGGRLLPVAEDIRKYRIPVDTDFVIFTLASHELAPEEYNKLMQQIYELEAKGTLVIFVGLERSEITDNQKLVYLEPDKAAEGFQEHGWNLLVNSQRPFNINIDGNPSEITGSVVVAQK